MDDSQSETFQDEFRKDAWNFVKINIPMLDDEGHCDEAPPHFDELDVSIRTEKQYSSRHPFDHDIAHDTSFLPQTTDQ